MLLYIAMNADGFINHLTGMLDCVSCHSIYVPVRLPCPHTSANITPPIILLHCQFHIYLGACQHTQSFGENALAKNTDMQLLLMTADYVSLHSTR